MQRLHRLHLQDAVHAALRGILNRLQILLNALVERPKVAASGRRLLHPIRSRSLKQLVPEAVDPFPFLFLFRRRTCPPTPLTSRLDFETSLRLLGQRLQTGSAPEPRPGDIPTPPRALHRLDDRLSPLRRNLGCAVSRETQHPPRAPFRVPHPEFL